MEKTGKPFFTIITSTLNVIDTIERCVKSVAEQTFRDYEHIIVDGASTDGTVEFLNLRKELFSVFISEPDTGIYNAWNKALKYAQGEWVLFLGADDILADNEVLADTALFIKDQKTEDGIVYGDIMHVSKENYEEINLERVLPEKVCSLGEFSILPFKPPHPGVFHHAGILKKYGPFDEKYKIAADTKLMIKAVCKFKEPIHHISRVINRMTRGGMSSRLENRVFWEDFRIARELKIRQPATIIVNIIFKFYRRILVEKILGKKMAFKIREIYYKLK